jgi:hypothetical protein
MTTKSIAQKMIKQRSVSIVTERKKAVARKKFIQSVLQTQPTVESHQQAKVLGEKAAHAKTASFLTKYRVGAASA